MGTNGVAVNRIEVQLSNKMGFQLRLASQFALCMQAFQSAIEVRRGNIVANGKNILELLILEAPWKSRLEIKAIGVDSIQAIEASEDFFENYEKHNGEPRLKVDCQISQRRNAF